MITKDQFDAVVHAAWVEMQAQGGRSYPKDPLRQAALVCEEAGELMKEALDLTRPTRGLGTMARRASIRRRIINEAVHTAVMAIRMAAVTHIGARP